MSDRRINIPSISDEEIMKTTYLNPYKATLIPSTGKCTKRDLKLMSRIEPSMKINDDNTFNCHASSKKIMIDKLKGMHPHKPYTAYLHAETEKQSGLFISHLSDNAIISVFVRI